MAGQALRTYQACVTADPLAEESMSREEGGDCHCPFLSWVECEVVIELLWSMEFVMESNITTKQQSLVLLSVSCNHVN